MRKILFVFFIFILFVAGCGSTEEPPKQSATNDQEVEEEQNDSAEQDMDKDENENDLAKNESEQELNNNDEQQDINNDEEKQDMNNDEERQNANKDEEEQVIEEENAFNSDVFREVINLSFKVFSAQSKQDYEFLQSVLYEEAVLNTDENSIVFKHPKYPEQSHEQDLITGITLDTLEYRFLEMDDSNLVTIGFAFIDYEKEVSMVVHLDFMKENDGWKLAYMTLNK